MKFGSGRKIFTKACALFIFLFFLEIVYVEYFLNQTIVILRYGMSFTICVCFLQVDTVKRLCIKKLPSVLAIQLKRFDYDWER